MNIKICCCPACCPSQRDSCVCPITEPAGLHAIPNRRKAEAALNEQAEPNRSRADYLRVIRAYERVYLITPHTAWADNALTSIARLYEAMKDPKNAVKTLQFLLHDYPQTPFRDVAIRDIARLERRQRSRVFKDSAVG